ncbi:MAG: hypothetical protein CMH83_07510 [Nocardioides sp.]|nr:hypothetical protein [Nocardioides sp.]
MDLSALIFVALALAWAAYLVPKALRHHEESAADRSEETVTERVRVVARREKVDRSTSTLVVDREVREKRRPASQTTSRTVPAPALAPRREESTSERRPVPAGHREAAARAARRRRRVLGSILAALAVVGVLAATAVLSPVWVAAPAALLVAWLVACRVMVKRERRVLYRARGTAMRARAGSLLRMEGPGGAPVVRAGDTPAAELLDEAEAALEGELLDDEAHTEEVPAVREDVVEADVRVEDLPAAETEGEEMVGGWAPRPAHVPTYVSKQAARRTVRTIDLDSTGVWTSGRTDADAAVAREAEEAAREQARDERDDDRRASGS